MGCVLTAAISKGCKDTAGGIKKAWAVELEAKDSITKASGEVSALTLDSGKSFFAWNFDIEMAKMTASPKKDDAAGTIYYEQGLNVRLHKWDAAKSNEIMEIANSDTMIIVLDNQGKYWLLGEENGMRWSDGSGDSGQTFADFNGFDMVFMGKEKAMPLEVQSSVITSLGLT